MHPKLLLNYYQLNYITKLFGNFVNEHGVKNVHIKFNSPRY